MSIKTSFGLLMATTALVGATPAAAASFINSTQGFSTVGTGNLYNGTGFSYYPLKYSKSVTVGGIGGSYFTGYYGAKLTGNVKAKLGFDASVSFTNSVQSVTTGKLNTIAANPFGALTPGSGFYFYNDFGASKVTSNIGKGQVDAALNASAYAGAYLYGKACVVVCTSGNIVNLGIGKPDDFHVFGYHSATNSVTFLDKEYKDVLPKTYQSDVLPLTAHLDPVNVSGSATGTNGNSFHTVQEVAGVSLDVAKTIVQAFGLPNDVISGSVLGVDYTTISAKVGVGINAIYDTTTSILSKYTIYKFSAPVQVFDSNTGKWGSTRSSITLDDGQGLVVRTVTPIEHLSILPEVVTYTQVNSTLTLDAVFNENVRLLEASGYGLSAGPLYEQHDTFTLARIGQFSASTRYLSGATLAPLGLDFVGASSLQTPDDAMSLMSLAGRFNVERGHKSFVFVPTPGAALTDTVAGEVRLAINFGTFGCDEDAIDACRYDDGFTPIATQQRLSRDVTGAPIFSYAVDFDTVDQLESAPDGAYGEQSSIEHLREMLANLPPPGPDGWNLPPAIADNSTPFRDAVPEPASWMLMIGGFGLLGGIVRRRRRAAQALVN
jgi:hypothetical protein